MANMKTLTVNGVTYTVDDPDAVSYGAQQALTEAQKQLARENIGAVGRTEVDDAVADLTQNNLDMKGHYINNVETIHIGNTGKTEGFFLGYRVGEDIPDNLAFDRCGVAEFYEVSCEDYPIILRNIGPGIYDLDAVNKKQMEDAIYFAKKDTIDKTCPAFTESGAIVTCEPVEGYPLTVVTAAGATRVTRCGKNCLAFTRQPYQLTMPTSSGGTMTRWGFAVSLPAGTYTLHAEPRATSEHGKFLSVAIARADGTYKEGFNLVWGEANNIYTKTISQGDTIYVYHGYSSVSQEQLDALFKFNDIQIEPGTKATAFESYRGGTFAPGDAIPALPGVNTIFADAGEVTVTGRANPATMIEKLTNAILSTGGNV